MLGPPLNLDRRYLAPEKQVEANICGGLSATSTGRVVDGVELPALVLDRLDERSKFEAKRRVPVLSTVTGRVSTAQPSASRAVAMSIIGRASDSASGSFRTRASLRAWLSSPEFGLSLSA